MKYAIFIVVILCGCTPQRPTATAPVYNITITDNTQVVVGDGNVAASAPHTSGEQKGAPSADALADNTTSNMWIFWLVLVGVTILAGWVAYKRLWK